jgi:hypothetical protein
VYDVDWNHLFQDRVTGSCEHDIEPSGSIKDGNFLTSLAAVVSQEGLCFMDQLVRLVHSVIS